MHYQLLLTLIFDIYIYRLISKSIHLNFPCFQVDFPTWATWVASHLSAPRNVGGADYPWWQPMVLRYESQHLPHQWPSFVGK